MAIVYLIPSLLHEEDTGSIPVSTRDAIRDCRVFFTENERTTRRQFKKLWKEMVIDEYEWITMEKKDTENRTEKLFREKLEEGKNIGIVSEAGCPGIADPGQALVAIAQEKNMTIRPLVGPSSILLALMASGMNGQHFCFHGYLSIDAQERIQAIRKLEADSIRDQSTRIFIETPYRNNQLLEALVKTCRPSTRLCIAVDLTSPGEKIQTRRVAEWKKGLPDLHKKLVIFLLHGG
jgi:16S rRNA (cytidine1402-2'-O)-methyltransferase